MFAPQGRDAAIACSLLRDAGIAAMVCADLNELKHSLSDDTSFAVVTEEALRFADLQSIAAHINAQPAWSDLPFIVLTQRGGGPETNPGILKLWEVLGNVTFLERPFHSRSFISMARTALKGRQRQYEARAYIEELHLGEARLRTALQAGRLGSWELDLSAGMLAATAACKALFGRAAEDPLSYEELLQCIHPEDFARVRAEIGHSVANGTDCALEYRVIWPDGSTHWAEICARPMKDRDGRRNRLIGVSSDITQRKHVEETLRHVNEILEERVAKRTAELNAAHAIVLAEVEQRERAEQRLRQAQKMEAIGQLTGGVAHDFNNLLTAVLGNLDLLRKHVPEDPKTQRLIGGALQGARRGATLTQRLLAFARQQDLKVEPHNLVELVRGMSELIERSAGPQIELILDLPPKLPLALIDANQLELAVLNLVVNARDAMPEVGTLTIKVDECNGVTGNELPVGHYVRLIVSDSGYGMDAVTLQRATEPFFTTKELGKGTGLGLSMVHGLAVQLNGALQLKSEVGHGTRVELWLPVTTRASISDRRGANVQANEQHPAMTVLVVDDDALIGTSTVDMVEDMGHTVLEARSGEQALALIRQNPAIDLLITDFSMPRMNGVQLASIARELRPGLPILLCTGYADLADGFGSDLPRINKPYHQKQLATEISRVLNSYTPRRKSIATPAG